MRVVRGPSPHGVPDLVERGLRQLQGFLYGNQKLVMILEEGIDVSFAVKPAIHDQLDLVKRKEINVGQQFTNRRDVVDAAGKLAIVDW